MLQYAPTRKVTMTLAFCVGALLVIGLGHRVWRGQREAFLGKLHAPRSYQLLDFTGKLYDTAKTPKKTRVLYIFLPDELQQPDVRPMALFLRSARQLNKWEVVLVSRGHIDTAYNFARAIGHRGWLLRDASGSFGRAYDFWQEVREVSTWSYLMLERGSERLLAATQPHPLEFSQLKKSAPGIF